MCCCQWGMAGAMPGIDPTVQQWFMAVDTDRSGRINSMELQQALGHQPWARFGPETCRLMISQYLLLLALWMWAIDVVLGDSVASCAKEAVIVTCLALPDTSVWSIQIQIHLKFLKHRSCRYTESASIADKCKLSVVIRLSWKCGFECTFRNNGVSYGVEMWR